MSVELSLSIIAISLLCLVIFAIIACIFAIQLLYVLKKSTRSIQLKVNPLLEEVNKIASTASSTAEQIKYNIELTTPLFHSIGKCANLVDKIPNRFKSDMHDNTMNIHLGSSKRKINVSDWAEWVALGIVLIQKLRNK